MLLLIFFGIVRAPAARHSAGKESESGASSGQSSSIPETQVSISDGRSQPNASSTTRQSGIVMLLLGVLFVPFFLFGGGVVTSSHAGISTAVRRLLDAAADMPSMVVSRDAVFSD